MAQLNNHGRLPLSDLCEHQVVRAWLSLNPDSNVPSKLETIRPLDAQKAPVFRLHGVGENGSPVIAKRSELACGLIEKTFYEDVLPLLPFSKLRWYGSHEDAAESIWLFVEDAGNDVFSIRDEHHRQIAIEWLAILHTLTPHAVRHVNLPDRGPDHYLARMSHCRSAILHHLDRTAFSSEDRNLLTSIVDQFDILQRNWIETQSIYEHIPKGVVHGDFKEKNVRCRIGQEAMMAVFDWENGGWGVPGLDMWKLDSGSYQCAVNKRWQHVTAELVHLVTYLGKLFWVIDAIFWEIPSLEYYTLAYMPEKIMPNMAIYRLRMLDASHMLGLSK